MTGVRTLIMDLKILVKCIGRTAVLIQAITGTAIPKSGAVPVLTSIVDVVLKLAEITGIWIKRAPLVFQVFHILCSSWVCILLLPRKIHGEFRLPIIPEDAKMSIRARKAKHDINCMQNEVGLG